MHLVTSCLLGKKYNTLHRIKCLMSLIFHQSNHIRNLIASVQTKKMRKKPLPNSDLLCSFGGRVTD